MPHTVLPDLPLAWDALWQSTLWLLAGIFITLLWSKYPARAHRLLLLAVLAALATPLVSQAVRHRGWGLFVRTEPASESAPAALPPTRSEWLAELAGSFPSAPEPVVIPAVTDRTMAVAPPPAPVGWAAPPPPAEPVKPPSPAGLLLGAWAVLTGLVGAHLLLAVLAAWRLLARARPVTDARLRQALAEAAGQLGLPEPPLLCSAAVRSPLIWCWGRQPVLLVPAGAGQDAAGVDWVSVFCHELAHWKRRDHLAGVAGHLLVALLPWQPLAWWARRRLGQLCERACDDWVLASGRSAVRYAESLLGLLPQRRPGLALNAVGSRSGLTTRIVHILARRRREPVPGRRWTALASAATAAVLAGVALAQVRTVAAEEAPPPAASPAEKDPTSPKSDQPDVPPFPLTVTGQVVGPDDKPVAGAQAALVAWPKLAPRAVQKPDTRVLGLTRADGAGRFRLKVNCPLPLAHYELVVVAGAKGYGPGWGPGLPWSVHLGPNQIVVRLAPEQTLRGRLIDLQGQPAAGVRVQVARLGQRGLAGLGRFMVFDQSSSMVTAVGMSGNVASEVFMAGPGMAMPEGQVQIRDGVLTRVRAPAVSFQGPADGLPFWPRPVTTDREGRFSIPGVSLGEAVGLLVRDDRFAVQVVNVRPPEKARADEFTAALDPARVVEGTVTAAEDGKPVPHARLLFGRESDSFLALIAERRGEDGRGRRAMGTGIRYSFLVYPTSDDDVPPLEVRADAQGRFRVQLFLSDGYTVRVTPPAGRPFLGVTRGFAWQRGTARRSLDLSLPPGVPVRGKVTETPSGKAVAGARVDFWSKGLKLPPEAIYPAPVQTDDAGNFEAVLPPGDWHALVNGASLVYLPTRLARDKLTDGPLPVGTPSPKPGETIFVRPDAWLAFTLKAGDGPRELKAQLRRVTLKGRVLAPDGKPAAKAYLIPPQLTTRDYLADFEQVRRLALDLTGMLPLFVREPITPVELRDGQFELPVRDLGAVYRLVFLDPANKFGALAEFTGQQAQDGPVTVRLAPCGSAAVRLLDAKGKPLANFRPNLWMRLPDGPHPGPKPIEGLLKDEMRTNDLWIGRADPFHYGDGPRTDAEGRVTLPALVPGLTYQIFQTDGPATDFKAEAGKVVTLPDVTVQHPEKATELPVLKPPQ
jgi:beta-lactamase regulating signal transducer with metallopeptidase domain